MTPWFRKAGGFYIPINIIGWIVTFVALLFLGMVYLSLYHNFWYYRHRFTASHLIIDTFYRFLLFTTCAAFWWKWIAECTSRKTP